MNKADINQTGGYKLTTNDFAFIQSAYEVFNSLADLAGNLTIIGGCAQSGNNIGDGFVAINGEVLAFEGGPIGTNVIISETVSNREFENGQLKPVYRVRVAKFGNGTTTYAWDDFVRLGSIKDLLGKLVEAKIDELGLVRYATANEVRDAQGDGVIKASDLPNRSANTQRAGLVERATDAEVDAGTDNERFITPKHLKDKIPSLIQICAGEVSSSGSKLKQWSGGLSFTSSRLSEGRYRINVGINNTNYIALVSAIDTNGTPTIKAAIGTKSNGYFEVGTADDSNPNDCGFNFIIYKL